MSFTVKAQVSNIEAYGNGQKKISFTANYRNAAGEHVNKEWAQATPAFINDIWIIDDVANNQNLHVGDAYTLTYSKD
jgi:hypothetical protein